MPLGQQVPLACGSQRDLPAKSTKPRRRPIAHCCCLRPICCCICTALVAASNKQGAKQCRADYCLPCRAALPAPGRLQLQQQAIREPHRACLAA